jgi:hypothetical protein
VLSAPRPHGSPELPLDDPGGVGERRGSLAAVASERC